MLHPTRKREIADDGDVVVLKLAFVEQLVVSSDPFGQVVSVFDHAGKSRALQRDTPGW